MSQAQCDAMPAWLTTDTEAPGHASAFFNSVRIPSQARRRTRCRGAMREPALLCRWTPVASARATARAAASPTSSSPSPRRRVTTRRTWTRKKASSRTRRASPNSSASARVTSPTRYVRPPNSVRAATAGRGLTDATPHGLTRAAAAGGHVRRRLLHLRDRGDPRQHQAPPGDAWQWPPPAGRVPSHSCFGLPVSWTSCQRHGERRCLCL